MDAVKLWHDNGLWWLRWAETSWDFLQFGKRKGLGVRDVGFSWGMFPCLLPLFASVSVFVALPTISFIVFSSVATKTAQAVWSEKAAALSAQVLTDMAGKCKQQLSVTSSLVPWSVLVCSFIFFLWQRRHGSVWSRVVKLHVNTSGNCGKPSLRRLVW